MDLPLSPARPTGHHTHRPHARTVDDKKLPVLGQSSSWMSSEVGIVVAPAAEDVVVLAACIDRLPAICLVAFAAKRSHAPRALPLSPLGSPVPLLSAATCAAELRLIVSSTPRSMRFNASSLSLAASSSVSTLARTDPSTPP